MNSFLSSTREIPDSGDMPRHLAVIMDGNGRWAKKRLLPRVAGHKRGVDALRELTRECAALGIEFLTVFAFSSENWRRPAEEVSILRQLFVFALEHEVKLMHQNNIRLRVIGDLEPFGAPIIDLVQRGEALTASNSGLTLTIAANYGGRWDLLQAVRRARAADPQGDITDAVLESHLALSHAPEPDLFIRTGGEQRISNFLLWQLAYTELYFTPTLWPDFDARALNEAIAWYRQRERRFGQTGDQVADRDAGLLDAGKAAAKRRA
jgi:undecaprenyl diphosphate synthase